MLFVYAKSVEYNSPTSARQSTKIENICRTYW